MTLLKVCTGRNCAQHSAAYLVERAKAELPKKTNIAIETCGCLGRCKQAPNISLNGTLHSHMTGPKLAQTLKKCTLL